MHLRKRRHAAAYLIGSLCLSAACGGSEDGARDKAATSSTGTGAGGEDTSPIPGAMRCDTGEVSHGFAVVDPVCLGIPAAELDALHDAAESTESDALILLIDGKIAIEWYWDGHDDDDFFPMSATKSITSLAIGMAVEDGALSLDQHPAALFQPWFESGGDYADITIRDLLSMSAGVDAESRPMGNDGSPLSMHDYFATVALNYPPGTSWRYSNAGVDSLALFFELATGEDMGDYLDERLFAPIGCDATDWYRSTDGVPYAAGELIIKPIDLARVGQLLLEQGTHDGSSIVRPAYIAAMQEPSTPFAAHYGYLWWRDAPLVALALTEPMLVEWQSYGLAQEIADKLAPLVDEPFAGYNDLYTAIFNALGAADYDVLVATLADHIHPNYAHVVEVGTPQGYFADGWMGQYLWVDDTHRLVAVRMHYPTAADYQDYEDRTFVEFYDFLDYLHTIAEALEAGP